MQRDGNECILFLLNVQSIKNEGSMGLRTNSLARCGRDAIGGEGATVSLQ